MLLSFSVSNFRLFADTVELSLASPHLKTKTPRKDQSWVDATERIAAIYGPNAAGKTTILDAIHALSRAIRKPGISGLHQPSLAMSDAWDRTTDYSTRFVVDGVLYEYEVSAAHWGIAREVLASYPKGSRRELFQREQDSHDSKMKFKKGNTLTGPTAEVLRITTTSMLFLANAYVYEHNALARIARGLVDRRGISYVSFDERHDGEVLKRFAANAVAGTQPQLVQALAQSADLGIKRIELREEEIPDRVRSAMKRIIESIFDDDEIPDDVIPRLREAIVFVHEGADGTDFELPLHRQSAGTIVWLTIAWRVIDALKNGSVLLVDELDASLHPELVRHVVELFLNSHLNTNGAQLIFSTHDVSLLGNMPIKLLEPEHVWFVEKPHQSSAELYSLRDFDNRRGNNIERQYLGGRFGATPDLDDVMLIRQFSEDVA